MRIVTNEHSEKSHLSELINIIHGADEIFICSGWMRMNGLKSVLGSIDAAVARGASIMIFSNAKHTEKKCLTELKARPGVVHVNVRDPYIHTKIYYGMRNGNYTAMIGSANITRGGLSSNEELSQVISGRVGEGLHCQLVAYMNKLRALVAT